jgi:hypothetical protein
MTELLPRGMYEYANCNLVLNSSVVVCVAELFIYICCCCLFVDKTDLFCYFVELLEGQEKAYYCHRV